MISFTANQIGCEDFEGTLIAGIGDESIGYIMFQRGMIPETGSDDLPYFEFDDQTNGDSDVIKSVELSGDLLIVHTDEIKIGESLFEIKLDANQEESRELVSQLEKIFSGHENLLSINDA